MVVLCWALFLPGSRAGAMEHYGHDNVTRTDGSLAVEVRVQPLDGRLWAEVSGSDDWRSPYGEVLPWILGGLFLASVAGTVCHMMPGLGGEGSRTGNFNYRILPAWSPENDNNYSFRAYMTDISLWVMLTDLAPHQQCAAVIMRLGGQARERARMVSPQEIVSGDWRDGALLDPVTYLLGALQLR